MSAWNELLRLQPKRFIKPNEIFLRLINEQKKLPHREWPITDFTELLALAKVIKDEESGPDPIPFAINGGRDPGPEDMEDGKCWCYEAAQIDICPDCYTVHGTGEGAWTFRQPVADSADRWLPASVRYLPARVEL